MKSDPGVYAPADAGILFAMNPSFLVLLAFLAGGGGGDLLDYVPTQSYWQDLDLPVTVDAMLAAAAPEAPTDQSRLIADLGSTDPRVREAAGQKIIKLGPVLLPQLQEATTSPDVQVAQQAQELAARLRHSIKDHAVRRLMALRALGELRDERALPFLQTQTASGDLFAADYAKAAVAAIQGHRKPREPDPAARNDLWLLPASCRAVAQLVPRGREPLDAEYLAAHLPLRADQDKAAIIGQMSRFALGIATRFGNARLDALSLGASEDFDGERGFLIAIFSGKFDSDAARQISRDAKIPRKNISGVEVFQPTSDLTFCILSDARLLLIATPAGDKASPDAMISSICKQRPSLKSSPEMTTLIQSVMSAPKATKRVFWAAISVGDAYRQLPGMDGFRTVTLSADERVGTLHLNCRGDAADPQTAHAAAESLNRYTADALTQFRSLEPVIPALREVNEAMASISFAAEVSHVSGSAQLDESPGVLFALPLLAAFGTQARSAPASDEAAR